MFLCSGLKMTHIADIESDETDFLIALEALDHAGDGFRQGVRVIVDDDDEFSGCREKAAVSDS